MQLTSTRSADVDASADACSTSEAPRRDHRGEPVTVLLRTGHMLKVSHGFDEDAFTRVVTLLERG